MKTSIKLIIAAVLLASPVAAQSAKKGTTNYAICSTGVSDDNDEPCYKALAKCSKRHAKDSKDYIKCREEAWLSRRKQECDEDCRWAERNKGQLRN